MRLIDRPEAQTQCGLLRSAHFQQTDVVGRLTSTQPSHSSRPDSPLSLSRSAEGMWSISAMLAFFFFFLVGFQCLQTVRCRGGAECLQVSGSSRQDLPAVGCLIGTPPVCFFCFPSAAALIVLAQRSLSHRGVELASSRLSLCSVSAATSCFKCVRAKRVSAPLKPHRCSQTDAITLERR